MLLRFISPIRDRLLWHIRFDLRVVFTYLPPILPSTSARGHHYTTPRNPYCDWLDNLYYSGITRDRSDILFYSKRIRSPFHSHHNSGWVEACFDNLLFLLQYYSSIRWESDCRSRGRCFDQLCSFWSFVCWKDSKRSYEHSSVHCLVCGLLSTFTFLGATQL